LMAQATINRAVFCLNENICIPSSVLPHFFPVAELGLSMFPLQLVAPSLSQPFSVFVFRKGLSLCGPKMLAGPRTLYFFRFWDVLVLLFASLQKDEGFLFPTVPPREEIFLRFPTNCVSLTPLLMFVRPVFFSLGDLPFRRLFTLALRYFLLSSWRRYQGVPSSISQPFRLHFSWSFFFQGFVHHHPSRLIAKKGGSKAPLLRSFLDLLLVCFWATPHLCLDFLFFYLFSQARVFCD